MKITGTTYQAPNSGKTEYALTVELSQAELLLLASAPTLPFYAGRPAAGVEIADQMLAAIRERV